MPVGLLAVSCRKRESCDYIGIGAWGIAQNGNCDTEPRLLLSIDDDFSLSSVVGPLLFDRLPVSFL